MCGGQLLQFLSIAHPSHKHPYTDTHTHTKTHTLSKAFDYFDLPLSCTVYWVNSLDKQCLGKIVHHHLLHIWCVFVCVFVKQCRWFQCKLVADRFKPWLKGKQQSTLWCCPKKTTYLQFLEIFIFLRRKEGLSVPLWVEKILLLLKTKIKHFKTHWIIWKMHCHKAKNRVLSLGSWKVDIILRSEW